MKIDLRNNKIRGKKGVLRLLPGDAATRKFLMLLEGQCGDLGPNKAAEEFGFSRQRYFQLLKAYSENGIEGLINKARGPKRKYRRTDQVVRQVIRHRFLDPQASTEVIAQKIRQTGFPISDRSVKRIVSDYGLQKKTVHP